MKNILIVFAFIFISTTALGQKKNELKSYEFKNAKPWMQKAESIVITTNSTQNKLTSPEFKNSKFWENKKEDSEILVIKTSKRAKLMGPKYKNFKH